MADLPILAYIEADKRRDAGIATASANCPDWYGTALRQIEQFRAQRAFGEDFIFEDIVSALAPLIGRAPNRHIQGAVCMAAIRERLIELADKPYRKAKGLTKNSHRNPVYRWRFDD
jgi:hypothetical protein